jgi:hypothetical protein
MITEGHRLLSDQPGDLLFVTITHPKWEIARRKASRGQHPRSAPPGNRGERQLSIASAVEHVSKSRIAIEQCHSMTVERPLFDTP